MSESKFETKWEPIKLSKEDQKLLQAFSEDCKKIEEFFEVDDGVLPEPLRKLTYSHRAHANSLMIYYIAKKIMELTPKLAGSKRKNKKTGDTVSPKRKR